MDSMEDILLNKEDDPKDTGVPQKPASSPASDIYDFIKIVLISLAIVLPIRFFVAQPFIVRGASMEPNYKDGQYLIVDESTYYFRKPLRDEVIVFRYPEDPSQFFIKRIIGLPGETIQIKNGEVTVIDKDHPEGLRLNELYLPSDVKTIPDSSIVLTSTQYFVMGDNRFYSSDSRRWGPLDKKYFIGRAWLRLWPLGMAGLLTESITKP